MSEALQLTLFTASVTLVSVVLSRFFMNVTHGLEDAHIFTRMRKVTYALPVFVLAGTVAFIFAIAQLGQEAAFTPFALTVSVLAFQLIMALSTFLPSKTRAKAMMSFEFRSLSVLTGLLMMVVTALGKLVLSVLRLSARTSRRTPEFGEPGNRGPHGYHGYLSYEEKAKRDFGQRF